MKLAIFTLYYEIITILKRFLKLLITSAIYAQKLKQSLVELFLDELLFFTIDGASY